MHDHPHFTAPQLVASLLEGVDAHPFDAGPGDLQITEALIQSHPTLLVCFDYARNRGSIGTQEAQQLLASLRAARHKNACWVLVIESSGIRVTDSTAGLASLRQMMREAADARLAGLRMLALVTRCAFGGASMIACACEQRVVHPGSVLAMSGPKLIQSTVGVAAFDASDATAVHQLLGGTARAATASSFRLAADVDGYRRALVDWLNADTPAPLSLSALQSQNRQLRARLSSSMPASAVEPGHDPDGTPLDPKMRQRLGTLLPPPTALAALTAHVQRATATSAPHVRALLISAADGASARDVLALSEALLEPFPSNATQPSWLVLLDAESHRAHPQDEQPVFSELLAHLALAMRALHRQGVFVHVIVTRRGGGGILGALGAGASQVSMVPDAKLSVLPRAALQSLNKQESAEAGTAAMALEVGAIDHIHEEPMTPTHPITYDRNFYDLITRQVQADANAVALEIPDGTIYTRGWLDTQSARYAHSLVRLGCQRGDRVAVQVDKSPHAIALFLGCVRAGFIFIPLNTAYQSSELEHLLGDAQPKVFVCRSSDQALASLGMQIVDFDQHGNGLLATLAADAPEQFDTADCTGEDIAALLYTSGTTGKPKGAMLSHRAIAYCALSLGHIWQFKPTDALLHALPLFHAHGLFISSNVALVAGARVLFHSRFDADALVAALPDATVFMGVPTFYHRLLAHPGLTPAQCRKVRLFTSGSAPLTASVHRDFEARTTQQIVERYGATETMIITSNPVDGERRPGSVGLPLPQVALRIAGTDTRTLPAGEIGMIQMRSPGLFSGYWRMPEQTKKEFTDDGYFITGDLGLLEADGYLSITGRSKDLIISGGYNVYPAELETALSEHAQVRECAVVGTPHADFGEVVVAFVIPQEGAPAPTAEAVIDWAKTRLANYKVPKQVFVVEELPRNAMGKVLKNDLRAQLVAKPAASTA